MKVKKPELKPCPFCGGAAELVVLDGDSGYKVRCTNLHCIAAYLYQWQSTEEAAMGKWNTRAYEDRATEREN